jgi:hypothetical protein
VYRRLLSTYARIDVPLSVEAVTRIAVLTVAPLEGVVMVRVVAKAVALDSSNAAVAKYKFFTEFSFFVWDYSGTKPTAASTHVIYGANPRSLQIKALGELRLERATLLELSNT